MKQMMLFCDDSIDRPDFVDAEPEALLRDGWDYYQSGWYDPDMDFENEDTNGVYIGDDE